MLPQLLLGLHFVIYGRIKGGGGDLKIYKNMVSSSILSPGKEMSY
jgi:hypothetical protein